MAIQYQFNGNSAVSQVALAEHKGKFTTAYLIARPGVSPSRLKNGADALCKLGFDCVPDDMQGVPVLKVERFNNKEKLFAGLNHLELTEGAGNYLDSAITEPRGLSWKEKLEERKLQASGAFYLVGDASYFMSGFKGSKPEEKAAGVFYALGSLVLAKYGKSNDEKRIDEVSNRLFEYLEKDGANIPSTAYLARLHKTMDKRTIIHRVTDLMDKYPSETLNAIYILAGLSVAKSGWSNKQGVDKMWDIAAGVTTAGSAAGSLVITEKHAKEGAPKRHGIMGAWDWIKEKPNRIAGYGFMVSTMMHAVSALREYQTDPNQKSYMYKMAFVVINIIAEVLMAESHKGGGVLKDPKAINDVVARAAETIAAQPKDAQAHIIHYVAGFIAAQPEFKNVSAKALTRSLQQHVQICLKNPWAGNGTPVISSDLLKDTNIVPASLVDRVRQQKSPSPIELGA